MGRKRISLPFSGHKGEERETTMPFPHPPMHLSFLYLPCIFSFYGFAARHFIITSCFYYEHHLLNTGMTSPYPAPSGFCTLLASGEESGLPIHAALFSCGRLRVGVLSSNFKPSLRQCVPYLGSLVVLMYMQNL